MKGQITLTLVELKDILAEHFKIDIKHIEIETRTSEWVAESMGHTLAKYAKQETYTTIHF